MSITRTRLLALTLLTMTTLTTNVNADDTSPEIAVGKPFPAIPFPTLDGSSMKSIEDFRGERLMLHNFASW